MTPEVAQGLKALHPLRTQHELFGPKNPFLGWVGAAAEKARADRQPMSVENPFLAMQEKVSDAIVEGLERYRKTMERMSEDTFRTIYGNKGLQKALGIDTTSNQRTRRSAKSLLHRELTEQRIAALRAAMGTGGLREAGVRALIYVGQPRGVVDERGFEAIRRLRRNDAGLSLQEFKALVRQQFLMLVIDEEAAMAALPGLLPPDQAPRLEVLEMLRSVLAAAGALDDESARRMELVTAIFTPPATPARPRAVASTKTA